MSTCTVYTYLHSLQYSIHKSHKGWVHHLQEPLKSSSHQQYITSFTGLAELVRITNLGVRVSVQGSNGWKHPRRQVHLHKGQYEDRWRRAIPFDNGLNWCRAAVFQYKTIFHTTDTTVTSLGYPGIGIREMLRDAERC